MTEPAEKPHQDRKQPEPGADMTERDLDQVTGGATKTPPKTSTPPTTPATPPGVPIPYPNVAN